jgi:indole-3-glycerol phosphate synthase
MVSESGLQNAESLQRLRECGFRGFLVGETLMRASDPEEALRDLIAEFEARQVQSATAHRT